MTHHQLTDTRLLPKKAVCHAAHGSIVLVYLARFRNQEGAGTAGATVEEKALNSSASEMLEEKAVRPTHVERNFQPITLGLSSVALPLCTATVENFPQQKRSVRRRRLQGVVQLSVREAWVLPTKVYQYTLFLSCIVLLFGHTHPLHHSFRTTTVMCCVPNPGRRRRRDRGCVRWRVGR